MILSIPPSHVLLTMSATNKESALRELAEVAGNAYDIPHERIFRILQEREVVGSTGIGSGIAIPHGKIHGLDRILVFFARAEQGINFDAVDGRPVFLFTLLLSPPHIAEEYLRTLAAISRVLKNTRNRERLLQTTSANEVSLIFSTES